MLRIYLRTTIRSLRQNKVFAGINRMDLSVFLTASFIILLYVILEMSCSDSLKSRNRAYRALKSDSGFKSTNAGTPYVLASALKEEFPQIEKADRIRFMKDFRLEINNEANGANDAISTSPDIYSIFPLHLKAGSTYGHSPDEKNSIILSKGLAEKLFPGELPVGKKILGVMNGADKLFTITGIFEYIPAKSTFRTSRLLNGKWIIDNINQPFKVTDVNCNSDSLNTNNPISKGSDSESSEKQFTYDEFEYMGMILNKEGGIQKDFSLQKNFDVF